MGTWPSGNQKRLIGEYLLVLSGCLALWIYGAKLVGDYRVDDAYITFAFSKNLALGNGPVYGDGLKDEGYSNFLWMVLATIGEKLSGDPLGFARSLSHGFFALILGATWLTSRRLAGAIPAALVTLTLACSSDFHRAIQSGLETVAFCGFIAAGLCHYTLEKTSTRRLSLLWFAGAALARIDGFIPLSFIIAIEGLRWLAQGRKESLLSLCKWVAWGIAPVAIYWLWRSSYYGLAFPLPYYAKASLGIEAQYRGADYLWNALRDTGLWIALAFAAFALAKRFANMWALVLFVALSAAYVNHVGGDWMPMNRMVLPLYCPLLVLFAMGLKATEERLPKHLVHFRGGAAVAALTCAITASHLSQWRFESPIEQHKIRTANGQSDHTHKLIAAVPFINAMMREPGETLVTDYGGIFAYGTDAHVIEMWGLANREIALRGNTDGINAIYGKTCVPCYKEFDPDYFHWITPLLRAPDAIRSKNQLIGQIFQGRALHQVLDFRKNYVVGRVTRKKTGESLFFLEKKRVSFSLEKRAVGDLTVDYPFKDAARRKKRSRQKKIPLPGSRSSAPRP